MPEQNNWPEGPDIIFRVQQTRGSKQDPVPDSCQVGLTGGSILGRQNISPDECTLNPIFNKPQGVVEPAADYGTISGGHCATGNPSSLVQNCTIDGLNQSGAPGNIDLIKFFFGQFLSKEDSRQGPAKWQEKKVRGAKIRQLVNQGMWKHDKTNNMPVHAALGNMLGAVLPAVKNVPTAIQEYNSILTGDMIGQMPGIAMSMGQMFQKIMQNQSNKQRVTANMSPETAGAFESIAGLARDGEVLELGGSITDFRVNESVFIENAIKLFAGCSTIGDIVECSLKLVYDTDLHGWGKEDLVLELGDEEGNFIVGEKIYQEMLEASNTILTYIGTVKKWNSVQKLLELEKIEENDFDPDKQIMNENKTSVYNIIDYVFFIDSEDCLDFKVETPFGEHTICVDPKGNTRRKQSDDTYNNSQNFSNSMTNPTSFFGPSQNNNLFGDGAKTMFEMIKRLPPGDQQAAKKLLQETNSDQRPQKHEKAKELVAGRNNGKYLSKDGNSVIA